MSFIPLKQTVTVTRYGTNTDIYGKRVVDRIFTLRAMVAEGSYLTRDSKSRVDGAVEVARVKVVFDKLADITYDDDIEYIDELGRSYKNKPIDIQVRRLFGKPILTEVAL